MGLLEFATVSDGSRHDSRRLEKVFNRCFEKAYKTRLHGGAEEPLYLPAGSPGAYHALHYRSDYFASALHEIAHWCLAGSLRRQEPDFGYWYTPDNRNVVQQRAFENVEYKPQALEWFFSRACGFRFQVSADNLVLTQRGLLDSADFKQRVIDQAFHWQSTGLPPRAFLFYQALCLEFATTYTPDQLHFKLADLV